MAVAHFVDFTRRGREKFAGGEIGRVKLDCASVQGLTANWRSYLDVTSPRKHNNGTMEDNINDVRENCDKYQISAEFKKMINSYSSFLSDESDRYLDSLS